MAPAPLPPEEPITTVYWLRLDGTLPQTPAIQYQYMQCRKWISTLHPYKAPLDDLHCTLNYTITPDDCYDDDWEANMALLTPTISTTSMFIGKEGVAAAVDLTEHIQQWYQLGTDSAPHITLAIGYAYEARSLGPMVKRALTLTWEETSLPRIWKAKEYTIQTLPRPN